MLEINRKLEYADRTAIQQADQTIKRDVVRALIELLTNADDSYRRLEQRRHSDLDGTIRIGVQRRRPNTCLRVMDWAEGMLPDRMDKCVGTYAEDTSGMTEGLAVRGFFGRGLKEAILGLGKGNVYSIADGRFTKCSIEVESGVPRYKREKAVTATRAARAQFGIADSGSIVEVTIARQGVRIPQIQNLRTRLERHYSLRDILSSPHRRVALVELDHKGKEKKEYPLQYRYPAAEKVLQTTDRVPGFEDAVFEVEVFRCSEPLEGPGADKESADGGLIIRSPRAVLDLTLFKFEHDPAAERLFGRVTCPHLDKLLMAGEPIVKADRTGIDWSHGFAKALRRRIEALLEPIVEQERDRARERQQAALSHELRQRIEGALTELNRIAQIELGKAATEEDVDDQPPFVPEGGFGFVPPYAQILVGKQALLLLRAAADKYRPGSIVELATDNEMVLIHTEQVVLESDPRDPGVLGAKVVLEGRQVGAEAIISATLNGSEAQAYAKVIAKREPAHEPKPKKKRGLFDDIRFDEQAEPRQRVRFEQGAIIVAVKAPSVSPYLGAGGAGTETPQGQVILAELVAEAVCREVAREGVVKGKFIAAPGAEADARQREYLRLQNLYAAKIHERFVDPQFRRGDAAKRAGRPPKEVTLGRSTVPA